MVGFMKASYLRENLDALRTYLPDAADAVRARVPQTIEAIEGAARTEWLDAVHDLTLTDAIYAETGRAGIRKLNRRAMASAIEGPLLGALWQGATKVFGLRLSKLVRWGPQTWGQLYRELGRISAGPQGQTLLLDDVPEPFWNSTAWLEGLCGALDGLHELCGARHAPEVTFERMPPAQVVFNLGGD